MKSCVKASYLMSKQLDTPLRLTEKTMLKVHMAMCKNCRRCHTHLNAIHGWCHQRHNKELSVK